MGSGIALDTSDNIYVIGNTDTFAFPTTPGAFDTSFNGVNDAFVAKLSADGSTLLYATFLGGSDWEWGNGIALDALGNAYVAGNTSSANFPTTAGAFGKIFNGGNSDAFVAKLSADGSTLLFSTFLGGSGGDWGQGIALDATGNAYVTGETASSNFPTTPGAFDRNQDAPSSDGFVSKIRINLSTSGAIWDSRKTPIQGARVEARDAAGTLVGTALTDVRGGYRLDLPAGQYTLTPIQETHLFSPTSRKVKIQTKDVEKQNFTCKILQIGGAVKDKKNKPLPGVDVLLHQGSSTVSTFTTDAKGKYAFWLYNTGSYTVEPTKEGSNFTPPSTEVVISKGNKGNVNFKEIP